jgi:hypothetical protein
MAYTYDPSQSIKQEFQQASSGIGNIFTQIIAQQQRDYSLAENTLNNVEALKKNIGIWGTKEVTDGANNLLGQVSSAINKNGKLDYSKLGQVRQEISNLADLKTGYDVFGKQFDRLVQIGAANKENLTSFESFYKNLVSLAADKKLIANPNDLATAMNNVLDDHINTAKMGVTAIKNNLAITPITGMYVDPKTKMEVTYNANVFDGVTVGADGKLIKPTDPVFYQNLAAKIKASDPAAFDAQRKKLSKIGQADIPDSDIAKSWFDSMPAGEIKPVSIKNERQVQTEEAQLKKLGTEALYQPQIIEGQLGQMAASTAASRAQTGYYNAQTKMLEGGATGSPVAMYSNTIYDPMSKKNVKYNAFPLETETPTSITLVNGKKERAIVSDIAIGDNGQIYAKVGVRAIQGSDTKRIVKDKKYANDYQFHKIDPSAVPAFLRDIKIAAGKSGNKKIKAEALSNINNIEYTYNQLKGANKPEPATPTLEKLPPITQRTSFTKQQLYNQGYNDAEIQQMVKDNRAKGIEITIKLK